MATALIGELSGCTYRSTYTQYSYLGRWFESTVIAFGGQVNSVGRCAPTCVHGFRLVEFGRTSGEEVPQLVRSESAHDWRLFHRMATDSFPNKEMAKLLYSVSEAAQLLSCSRNTVYALMRSGQILAVYPTSKARIPATALLCFVQSKVDEARAEREISRRLVR